MPVFVEQLRTLVNSFMIHINLASYVLFMMFFGIRQISLQCNILLSHLLKFLRLRPSLSVRYDCVSKVFPKVIRGCHYIIVLIESPEWNSISSTRQGSYCSPAGATYYIGEKIFCGTFHRKKITNIYRAACFLFWHWYNYEIFTGEIYNCHQLYPFFV